MLIKRELKLQAKMDYEGFGRHFKDIYSDIWKYVHWFMVAFIISISICKYFSSVDLINKEEYRKDVLAHKEALIVKQAEKKLNKEVFFYCLDVSKGKDGIATNTVKECKEAAMLEVQYGTEPSSGIIQRVHYKVY